jgi:hypothetical protein
VLKEGKKIGACPTDTPPSIYELSEC